MEADVLARFSAATREWFAANFTAPTDAQAGAWDAISSGEHTLVVAPTGSGKTLAAFLWAIDQLAAESVAPAGGEASESCRVLYISPLKALAVDVERNLRSPLVGIGHAAERLGLPRPRLRVAVRSGDTPAEERRAFIRHPADILITTPESLFLLLTSSARDALRGVETVIVDEVHAVAGTKRGAHLALSLERLDALLPRPAQRIGLSATVRPIEEVARFLGGGRPVTQVVPPSHKRWDLSVVVPVPDLGELSGAKDGDGSLLTRPNSAYSSPGSSGSSPAAGEPSHARLSAQPSSIWPHVEERIADAIASHRSTLVFVNSRRLAERLTARLNELWAERLGLDSEPIPRTIMDGPFTQRDHTRGGTVIPGNSSVVPGATRGLDGETTGGERAPAEVMAQSAISHGAPPVLARAHHGSVSREQRQLTEEDLKAGRLPAVVATSSLELGIDMGAVDLVVQVEAPPSVASGLQRVGRAGHQVGAVSSGIFFPKFRGDLVQTAVAVERMLTGQIESLHVPANPLDVLAQQIVAMVAMDAWQVGDLETLVRRAAPFAGLTRAVLASVLDMLAGRYPSDEFAELRPRLVWDRATDTLTGRRSAQRLAVTSGGTIPDRGLYGVFVAGEGEGRRVGELDEEMVYESRTGDVIALGTTSWRIEEITHDRVLVSPAPGQAARLPFWKGDGLGRPAELGRAVGAFVREVSALKPKAARERLAALGLDEWASDNLLGYLTEQRDAIGRLPTDRQIVVERFRDELGDWQVIVHSPFGAQVHAPWALVAAARLRDRFGVDVQAMHADDGLVFRLPDTGWFGDDDEPAADGRFALAELLELIFPDPDEVAAEVTAQVGGSALFASRFRECAGRALLLPNRRPGHRQALWQQRQRSAQLLSVASEYPDFPIVLEAVRECLNDVFDLPALVALMSDVRSRKVSTVAVDTTKPSPFASSLLFGYVAQFLYEGDSPLAEKRAAALALDPTLLAELLGTAEGLALADLLDPDALTRTEQELQHLVETRKARDADELTDLLRELGPLAGAALAERCREPEQVPGWLARLAADRRVLGLSGDRWVVVEDAARVRDALGVQLPPGVPDAFTEPVPDPLGDLVGRYARSHAVFSAAEAAAALSIGPAVARDVLARLVAAGRVVTGELRPPGWVGPGNDRLPRRNGDGPLPSQVDGPQYADSRVLQLLRRRSLAALRDAVEPVAAADFAGFLPGWQGVGRRRGVDGLLQVVEQLAGVPVPASALESLVLPARVVDYRPAMLDELTTAGEVVWQGHGPLGTNDGWVSLHSAELALLTLAPPAERDANTVDGVGNRPQLGPRSVDGVGDGSELRSDAEVLLDALGTGGLFFPALVERTGLPEQEVTRLLWELVWSGRVSNDSLAPLRALLGSGTATHRVRPRPGRARYRPALSTAALTRRLAPPQVAGRWSALPVPQTDPTARALATAELMLDRYGIVTRGSVAAAEVPGGFAAVYRVLAAAEEAGRVRRGYFVEGLGAAQFGAVGAIDRLRAQARPLGEGPGEALVLAATDPANPYGAALGWPARDSGHLPGRKAGALVVLVDGQLVLYVERGGRTLLSFTEDDAALAPAAKALAQAVQHGVLGRLTVAKVDGEAAIGSTQPLAKALAGAGFVLTPQGLRIR
jgi:ATP-dependent Lhr-like helicase